MSCPAGLTAGFGLSAQYAASVCYIRSNFGAMSDGHGLFRLGTGAIMKTDETGTYVLTAAHNLFINDLNRTAKVAELWFGCVGTAAKLATSSNQYRMPDEFKVTDYDAANDFALIWVPAMDTATFPPISLFQSSRPQNARLVGYPVEGVCAGKRQPYHADLVASPSGSDSISYDQVTYEGMSGGPLVVSRSGGLLSCGVHIQGDGADRAVRVSPNMIQHLDQWVKN